MPFNLYNYKLEDSSPQGLSLRCLHELGLRESPEIWLDCGGVSREACGEEPASRIVVELCSEAINQLYSLGTKTVLQITVTVGDLLPLP